MTLPGYFWDRWPYFAGKLSWDITKCTQVNSALHPSGVAKSSTSFGWGKGGKVTSAGWQITLCNLIRHVISRSGVVISITNCSGLLYFTLLYFVQRHSLFNLFYVFYIYLCKTLRLSVLNKELLTYLLGRIVYRWCVIRRYLWQQHPRTAATSADCSSRALAGTWPSSVWLNLVPRSSTPTCRWSGYSPPLTVNRRRQASTSVPSTKLLLAQVHSRSVPSYHYNSFIYSFDWYQTTRVHRHIKATLTNVKTMVQAYVHPESETQLLI